ncbi:ABC transporter ATP-binding protein [Allostreptomyces psammosilenae]|uniref:ABC-2 type transport system ATP-binding protein n=1 Tax=Allostreptomyces psammosilenae TaxID=1892865 RepID=A0A853A372_9ACTN|nr:ABC transporter ATP-binding protein [Allostreptomyces psammosilenae]NYI07920.1 ABC-2 type transport system ATP-binding protein [Allostreptomyces psammosilenae]
MIVVDQLTKSYGDKVVVDHLSFTVRPGVVTGFLGPNGSGKSTTMRMILGLDAPTSGTVTVAGRAYVDAPVPMRTVGALLDAKAVHGGRTARNHLLWLAHSNGIPARRVDEVLADVGLKGAAHRRAGTFSLGMSQRLGIAAALLGDPEVLMLDEPVNGLDPEGILWIRTLMRRLAAEGRTVLLSSHLMSEMALTADHLIVIGRGRLIADTGIEDFVRTQSDSSVLVHTAEAGDGERLAGPLRAAGAEVAVEEAGGDGDRLVVTDLTGAQIGRIAVAEGIPLAELSPRHTSLEEAYLRMTRDSVEYSVHGEGGA